MRTIAHISDIHFGRIDLRIADALARQLNEISPSLTIVSGDLTQRARSGQFRAAAEYLQRLPQPQLVVPGNHDVPLYDFLRRFCAPTQLYRRYITENLAPTFEDDELCVVGLNSTRAFTPRWRGFWKDGRLSKSQLAAAIDRLRVADDLAFDSPRRKLRLLVTHHPIVPAPGGDLQDRLHLPGSALLTLAAAGVDFVLGGHLHRSYVGHLRVRHEQVQRISLSIQAGTATSTRLRGEANAFNLLRLNGDRGELLVHRWNGVTFAADEPRSLWRYVDGWHTA